MVSGLVFNIGVMLVDKIFDSSIEEMFNNLKERTERKKILSQIKIAIEDFNTKFDDSELDTRSFYKFLNEDSSVKEYFGDLFWKGKLNNDEERLDSIVRKVIDVINQDRKKRGISSFSDNQLLYEYFREIEGKLDEIKRNFLGFKDKLLVTTIISGVSDLMKGYKGEQLEEKIQLEKIGVRTYLTGTNKMLDECNFLLDLTDYFDDKVIKNDSLWNSKILPEIKSFVDNQIECGLPLAIEISAVQSVAFALGYFAHAKSNKNLFPIQGKEIWDYSNFRQYNKKELNYDYIDNKGNEIVVVIDLMDIGFADNIEEYYNIDASDILRIQPDEPARRYVLDGHHCLKLVYDIDAILQGLTPKQKRMRWKFAIAAPNAFIFMLGRQATQYGKITFLHHDTSEFTYSDSIILK
ncbi:SAVED domain-containing protein [Lactococcus raffinolactis]|uniref:SAVED domain-containing protein n=1 Tax=Pseudolactococcus raffinolactis TaxID=1366 RepID=UPI001436AE98|nr:SAVED domain-containing protein [Lactococcus raffinolactis]QIW60581.1 SAVED domain-containing protein [Lactococcus raffinolactis]